MNKMLLYATCMTIICVVSSTASSGAAEINDSVTLAANTNLTQHYHEVMKRYTNNNNLFQSTLPSTPSFLDGLDHLTILGKAIQDIGFMAIWAHAATKLCGYDVLRDKNSLRNAIEQLPWPPIDIIKKIGPELVNVPQLLRINAGLRQILEIDPPLLELY
jgi:hypothetical protein